MRWGLRSKFLAVLLIITALFLIIIVYSYSNLNSLHKVASDMNLRFEEYGLILDVGTDILSATKPVHFFTFDGNKQHKKEFDKNISRAKNRINLIRESPILDSKEKLIIEQLESSLLQAETAAQQLFLLPEPLKNPQLPELSRSADRRLHHTISLINNYKVYENKEINESMAVAEDVYGTRNNYLIAIVVMMASVVVAMLIVNFTVINPILKISKSVDLFGHGQYRQRLRIHTGDEIESLAESFNQMAFNMWQEGESAALVQQRLLPQKKLRVPGLRLHARQMQAKIIGGDWYDYYKQKNENISLLIADASGKGMPGALLSTVAMSVIRSEPKNIPMIEILKKSNQTVERRLGRDDFITLFSAIVDLKKMKLHYINCGHERPLIFDPDEQKWTMLECESGLPLGITSRKFQVGKGALSLKKGSKVILYTDGLTDVKNSAQQRLSIEAVVAWLEKHKNMSIEPLVDGLLDEAVNYCSRRLLDDITLLGLEMS